MRNSNLFVGSILLFLSLSITAQKTIWFDANWNVTDKDKAVYYRPAPKKKLGGFWIVDYYKNGNKQKQGFGLSTKIGQERFEGQVRYFFDNGKIFRNINYNQAVKDGYFFEFYRSGELKIRGKFEKGKREGIWKTFYKNGKIKMKGKYSGNNKVGVWKTFYKNVY